VILIEQENDDAYHPGRIPYVSHVYAGIGRKTL